MLKRSLRLITSLNAFPRRQWPAFAAVVLAVFLTAAWVRPELPVAVPAAGSRGYELDEVLVMVNGTPRVVARGRELTVWWGDRIEMRHASVSPAAPKDAVKIHVYGYLGRPAGSFDDLGRVFTTDQLKARYAEAGLGEVYAAVVSVGGQASGAVFLRLVAPELVFAELTVNGRKLVVRSGDTLGLTRRDQIKVERVQTNVPDNADIVVQMLPASGGADAAMRFSRGGRVFASIILKVSG